MQAVILAGGKGTRLASRLNGLPKPLVDVGGEPLLRRQLRTLTAHGVEEAVILVNHAADRIKAFIDTTVSDIGITLVDDGEPRGTAGATLACLDQLRDRFLVVYGDTLFDIDVSHMLAAHESSDADATLLLHPNDHPHDSDLIETDEQGWITAFHPYPHQPGRAFRNLVNAAFYIVEKRALTDSAVKDGILDFAKDLFPQMLKAGARLKGYSSFEYIKDLGTPKRLDKVERDLSSGRVAESRRSVSQRAVFMDRDGTLNAIQPGQYISHPDQLTLLPGAGSAVRRFNEAGYRVVAITNQPVLARGECDMATMGQISAALEWQLGESGAFLDASYMCPHHPDAGFPGEVATLKVDCACRKPRTGLIDAAVGDLNIDVGRSWLIGDSTADILAANRAGLLSVLLRTGEGGRDGKHPGVADFTVDGAQEAARLILDFFPQLVTLAAPHIADVQPGDLILIGGAARSGKSGLAAAMRASILARGIGAATVALDRWIQPANARHGGLLDRFSTEEMLTQLKPWLQGSDVETSFPYYDRTRRARGQTSPQRIRASDVMIIEGVPALLAPFSTPRRVHRFHVDAEEGERAVRVMEDIKARYGCDSSAAERIYQAREGEESTHALVRQYSAPKWKTISLDSMFGSHG